VSKTLNSGRTHRLLAVNPGRKNGCLQVLWFIFAGRHS
jgi:hypothetical protein